jgi:hypothetical protein
MVFDYQATLLARIAVLDQRLREPFAALQRESDGGPPVDTGGWEAPRHVSSAEVVTVWEATVRRLTDSLDVRLDLLQDELDGLADELRSLQKAKGESAHAAERRAVRVCAAGQSVLGLNGFRPRDWLHARPGREVAPYPSTSERHRGT